MLRIRLRRQGAKKQPTYRIVVADQREARDGRFVEVIGNYNPRTQPAVAHVDEERAFHWLGNGARPSDAVERIFSWTGTGERFKRLKEGEDISQLLVEAEKATGERPAPTKTRYDAPASVAQPKKIPKTESGIDTDADAGTEDALETDAEADVPSEIKTESEVDYETVTTAKAETEASSESEADVESDVEAVLEPETKPGATTEDEIKGS